MTFRETWHGYALLLLAVTFWSGSASLAKYLFTVKFDAVIISQMRVSISFLLLAGFFLMKDRTIFKMERKDLPQFVFLGLFGVAATNFAYYFTVQESTVATAILIQYTAPVLVMLYAVGVSKEEEFTGIKGLALLFSLVGCFLAVGGGSVESIQLEGWTLVTGPAASLCYSYMLIAGKHILRKYPVWTMLTYAFAFATLAWLFVNPPWEIIARNYTGEDWGIFFLFAVTSILIPHAAFSTSLKLLEASTVGIVSTMEPIMAIVIAALTLGETVSGVQALGGLAVVLAVVVLQVPLQRFGFGQKHEK
ncbi:MAG TPA: EamA family transporter [Bacteroidota bacterium]|nr:EamA family transporter [Bacteroidota bacterium]